MLDTDDYHNACAYLESERHHLTGLAADTQSHKSANAGIKFLDYFEITWLPEALWDGWSAKGRREAAVALGISIEGVLPTTNHLESFNGVLKRKHIARWQHAGRRLRFDVLINRLIITIMPNIYGQHRMLNAYSQWKTERFRGSAGGLTLTAMDKSPIKVKSSTSPVTWFVPDRLKDNMAKDIVHLARLTLIESRRMYELWASCAATHANVQDPEYERYYLTVHPSGAATCTCIDWLKHGGACKHLRAFRFMIEKWSHGGCLQYTYYFPQSQDEALRIEEQNRLWYGQWYDSAITSPALSMDRKSQGLTRMAQLPCTLDIIQTHVPLQPRNIDILPSLEHDAELEIVCAVEEDSESTSVVAQEILDGTTVCLAFLRLHYSHVFI
jgi:hypothetical protein